MIDQELIRKHIHRLVETNVTVKAHTSRSKKGKAFNVRQHEREVKTVTSSKGTEYRITAGENSGGKFFTTHWSAPGLLGSELGSFRDLQSAMDAASKHSGEDVWSRKKMTTRPKNNFGSGKKSAAYKFRNEDAKKAVKSWVYGKSGFPLRSGGKAYRAAKKELARRK